MRREQVLRVLREHRDQLVSEFGVKHLRLFGSVARGEASAASDVDLLVEFGRPTGYFGLVRLQLFLQQLLAAEVDLGTLGSLRPSMRERIEKEAICVA
jgi:predicted nucleotidyltransferase